MAEHCEREADALPDIEIKRQFERCYYTLILAAVVVVVSAGIILHRSVLHNFLKRSFLNSDVERHILIFIGTEEAPRPRMLLRLSTVRSYRSVML
jgi:hypothetical protein